MRSLLKLFLEVPVLLAATLLLISLQPGSTSAEEWVSRDDLGLLLQSGTLSFEPCMKMNKN